MVEMGDAVRDPISGFRGTVTAVMNYLHGCQRGYVQPPVDKDGNYREGIWLDLPQLETVEAGVAEQGRTDTGGPRIDPPAQR